MSNYSFVQVNQFQANAPGWNTIGNVNWQQSNSTTFLLTNSSGFQVQLSFLSNTTFRIRFNPVISPDYSANRSYAVVNYQLGSVMVSATELPDNGGTLLLDTGNIQVKVGLAPFGFAVYKGTQLITETQLGTNVVYSNQAIACIMNSPEEEAYYGLGEKAGSNIQKNAYTYTFFNYDNFTYNDQTTVPGQNVVPPGNQGGPLNPSGPLYNSIPFLLAAGTQSLYSYGIFFDNTAQSYFNIGCNDYSDMDGKYYFGALYGELDFYVITGVADNTHNVATSVIDQYTQLTGRAAMPPQYALGYHQGCYGYWDSKKLLNAAQQYRDNQIPIDGLHIDVDFQDNYRTFTISNVKFPEAKTMFDNLHSMGFVCSTNITGIVSANPLDENGSTTTPYPTRDTLLNLNQQNAPESTYKPDAPVQPFIFNTRAGEAPSPLIFLANENYGTNSPTNPNINPYQQYYPTPASPQGSEQLGTYGFYSNMCNPQVQAWWGLQYKYLLQTGIDMIWQDMTDPAVVPNEDNNCDDKTLPLDLMRYDYVTQEYQPEAVIHNTFAINLVKATYNGLTALKSSEDFKGLYNYQKRNFIISRGGYAGVHRYAGIWTGDSASSWDFLSINIPEVLNIGISGLPISGCDVGGFANGPGSVNISINNQNAVSITDPELYVRWMNCAAFLPWYRNHYDGYTKSFQEPYAYGDPYMSYCRTYINMRYQLIQLFYDTMYECTQNGKPISRALFLNDITDPNVFGISDEFFVGKDLLIAPVITQGATSRNVYLPAGSNWYVFDITGGQLSSANTGGQNINWYVPLGLVPIYVREGAIIPVRGLQQYTSQLEVNPIHFFIYPGANSTYTLYLDDKITTGNLEPKPVCRTTVVTTSNVPNGREITFQRTYDNYSPAESNFFVELYGYTTAPSAVTINGLPVPAVNNEQLNSYCYDSTSEKVVINVADNNSSIVISVTS